ncbi:hypothetical protein OA005_00090 [Paracoccaceae bacterium]|nr:hypothetical protein [Paracoccaceae bacterium]
MNLKKGRSINLVSIREVTPDVGEEKLTELRFKRGSEILGNHEATTHL